MSLLKLRICFCQQGLDGGFGFLLSTFADMNITNMSLFVNQVQGGPVAIIISAPCSTVIILRHCVFDLILKHGSFEIIKAFFKGEFGVMIANDNQTLTGII
jgi:hypothetical protein